MFKYLRKLFNNVVLRSRKLLEMCDSEQIETSETENERNVNNNISSLDERNSTIPDRSSNDNREFSTLLRDEKIPSKNIENFHKPEMTNENEENLGQMSSDEKKLPLTKLVDEEKFCETNDNCQCANCSIVASFSECVVCLEPLQTRGVKSCPLCDNIACSKCATKLKKCAFCRIALPMQRNRAIERFIQKLELPCRNHRSGCKKLLKSETRLSHELVCIYASISCPISCECHWQGSSDKILSHLKKIHDLAPLYDNGVEIEFVNFRGRSYQECCVFLSCYNQLYAIKVTAKDKILVTIFQLGYIVRVNENVVKYKYRLMIRIRNNENKKMRGVLTFDACDRNTREIEMDSERLFLGCKNSKDTLAIEILIHEIVDNNN